MCFEKENVSSNLLFDFRTMGWKCLLVFFILLYCFSGLAIGLTASYFLVMRFESHGLSPEIMLCFLLVTPTCVITTTALGWTSVRNKNFRLIKLFAILIIVTALLEISGGLWCFGALQKTQNVILKKMAEKFLMTSVDYDNENYWHRLQKKFKCCGLKGPEDYKLLKNNLPLSCCDDSSQKFCTTILQKGCSEVLMKTVAQDFTFIGLMIILTAFLQFPGVFFVWCFANKISKEQIKK